MTEIAMFRSKNGVYRLFKDRDRRDYCCIMQGWWTIRCGSLSKMTAEFERLYNLEASRGAIGIYY